MFKKKNQQVRRAYGGWDDDDNSSSTNNQSNNSNVPKFLKNQNQNPQNQYSTNNNNSYSKQNQNLNYNQNIRRENNQTFDLEQKLFEDILQPTGISVKPDLKLLRDFCQRAQRLDKEKIINLIMERIVKYEVYVGGEASIKMFLKCLYLVEFIIDNQVNELYDGFSNQNELFENIKITYSNNKKVTDVINHILKMLYNQQNENSNQGNIQKGNANLLDIEDGSNNNVNNNQGNTNLLEDIFSGGSSNNTNNNNIVNNFNLPYQNNNVPFNIPTNNTNQMPIMSNQTQQQTQQSNQFGFIKSQQGNQNLFINNQNPQNTQNTQKKGFSFIKNQQNTSNIPSQQANNDLNNIFQNIPQNQTTNQTNTNKTGFKFIKKQDNALENVFNTQNINTNTNNNTFENIDLTKQNQTPIQQQPPQPIFNYQQVYENTEILNTKKKMNDPFNFVDDLLKPKK
jgi:hypothetical protein